MYDLTEEYVAIDGFKVWRAVDGEGRSYAAEGIFGRSRPEGKILLNTIRDLKRIIKRESEAVIDDDHYIPYLSVVIIEGEHYLLRRDRKLLPLSMYLEGESPKLEVIAGWMVTILRVTEKAQESGIFWQILHPESLWIDEEGELYVLQPEVTKNIIHYRDELSFGWDPIVLQSAEFLEEQDWDEKSTVYSLGVLFYFLLTSKRPFEADNQTDLVTRIMHTRPTEPRIHNPQIGPGLDRCIRELLSRDFEKRPNLGEARRTIEELRETGRLRASEEEEALSGSRRKTTLLRNRIQDRLVLTSRYYWRVGAVILLFVVMLGWVIGTNIHPPVITAETAPDEVVAYFYEGINERNYELVKEAADTSAVPHLRHLITRTEAMERAGSIHQFRSPFDEQNEEGQAHPGLLEEKYYYIRGLNIEAYPPTEAEDGERRRYRATYTFILQWPGYEGREIEMEDRLVLDRDASRWRIIKISGSVTDGENFEPRPSRKD